ncbi:ferredoxin--nitrite reductase [Lactococcus hodotermopsidis]|uniref:Ferredoxin--nitrite reductase n=1 Tax=Pseudolactococcus hodotermopsidis TaxID=2709157 RepID=A0A6A0BD35_9LACT|nr:nitrite/sulfite reductase [Lactococcus hodotermopsidis]GFH41737.1 ferredoxin--nitrite reductase [Lactococcus hodotermopsidis]
MTYVATWATEKLNKNEIAKLEKDGLAVFDDFSKIINTPWENISKYYYMYFKYAGLTVQKPQTDGKFMLRVKIPAGMITVAQAKLLANLALRRGGGFLDITTRQSVQYHNIKFSELLDTFSEIEAVGLTTRGAEGDINRNVIGNPLAGIDKFECFDATPTLMKVHTFFQGNTDYSNLPRKFKISVSASTMNSANAEINDLAFLPATKKINGQVYKGFAVKVGGGLGAKPYLAQYLDLFVKPSQVVKVAEAVVRIYRDHGYRRNRAKARIKFLLEDWGVAKFTDELLKLTGPLASAGENITTSWSNGLVLGVHPQRQSGYSYIGVSVPTGRIAAKDLAEFAKIAEQYGRDEIRFDHSQNLLIPFIKDTDLAEVVAQPIFERFSLETSRFQDYGMTCTGNEYCNLALTSTKDISRQLLTYLDDNFQFERPVRVILTGCMNACAHRNIADIGIQGVAARDKNRQPIEAFTIAIGGTLLNDGHFNEDIKGKVPKSILLPVVKDLVSVYAEQKHENETFYDLFERIGLVPFQDKLSESLARHDQ